MDGGASDQATSYLATVLAEAERRLDAGDADGAVAVLDESLAQARNALAYGPQGLLHAAIGDVHRQQGTLEAALTQYEQAAAALHEAGDTAAEAGALLRCGDAQRALKRVGAATQSYTGATALYDLLDDPRGAAHGEFLLAELAAGVHRDIAEKHYARAIELYREAAGREGAGAAADAAELPEAVADPRPIDSGRMVEVAARGLERLREGPVRPAEPAPAVWTPPPAAAEPSAAAPPVRAPAVGPARNAPLPLLLPIAALALGSIGVLLIATQSAEEMVAAGIGALLLTAVLALLAVRRSRASTPYISYGAAGLAWLVLLASGARSFVRQHPGGERPAVRPTVPIVTPAPVREPWTPEGQRAIFARELAGASSPRAQADVLRRSGEFERQQGERRRCLELWAESQDRYRAAAVPGYAADVAMAIGDVHMRAGRPAPARQRFDDAVALYGEARDPQSVAGALRRRGEAEAALGRWSAAGTSYAESLRIARTQRDAQGEILALLRLAEVNQALARPAAARDLLYRAVSLSAGDVPMQARVWLALADFEAAVDQDAAALRAYESAATLAGAGRDADLEARGVRHRAAYERRLGKLEVARGRYEVAIRLALAREALVAAGLTCLRAAELEAQIGDVLAARDFYATAEALFAQRPNASGSARVALGLGDLSAQYGDPVGARREYARALELADAADHTGLQLVALERLSTLLAGQEPAAVAAYAQRAAALRAEAYGAGAA